VVVSQSGFQSTYGGGTVGPEISALGGDQKESRPSKEVDPAVFVAGAFFCVLTGLFLSLIALFRSGRNGMAIPGLAGIGVILVALQLKVGFPLERAVTKSTTKEGRPSAFQLGIRTAISTKIVYRPWIYLELGFLVLPLGIAFFAMKPKKAEPRSES
jgi:hypothetical protein